MTLNTAKLEMLRTKKLIPRRDPWRPPTMTEIVRHEGKRIIAVDQSLSATGLVVILVSADHLSILRSDTLRGVAADECAGYEETLQRALNLGKQLATTLGMVPDIDELVHEGVPIGGGKIVRPESSLMASLALRQEAGLWGIPVKPMVQPQTHRRVVCGNQNASKKEEHEALATLAQSLPIIGYELITNEATRDALCVGIAHLVIRNEG
jgi:hypothetical protein